MNASLLIGLARPAYRLLAASVVASLLLVCQAGVARAQAPGAEPLQVIRTVVIDPGHGGGNEGTEAATGHREKDEVLRVAYALRAHLLKTYPGLDVVLTRTMDVDLELTERIQVANRLDADVFISIHMNASANTDATGFEVFYLRADKSMPLVTSGEGTWGKGFAPVGDAQPEAPGHHHDAAPAQPAQQAKPSAKAKAPEYGAYDEALPVLLADLDRGRAHRDSALWAELLLDEMATAFRGRRSRGVRQANFGVLRGALVPSVVVELGFLSNPEEATWLRDPKTHTRFVGAVSRALRKLDSVYKARKYHEAVRPDR